MTPGRLGALFAGFLVASVLADPPVFISHGDDGSGDGCKDSDAKCALWASEGECQSNAAWMMANCRRSCQSCQGVICPDDGNCGCRKFGR